LDALAAQTHQHRTFQELSEVVTSLKRLNREFSARADLRNDSERSYDALMLGLRSAESGPLPVDREYLGRWMIAISEYLIDEQERSHWWEDSMLAELRIFKDCIVDLTERLRSTSNTGARREGGN
jgi:hypothetical protein